MEPAPACPAGAPCTGRSLSLHSAEAFGVEGEQLVHLLFGFRSGGGDEAGGRRSAPAQSRRRSDKLQQIQCDIFIAARAIRGSDSLFHVLPLVAMLPEP